MPAQVSTRSVANAHFFDQRGIMQAALLQIVQCFGVAIELLLIESGGLLKHISRVSGRRALLLEVEEALAEGQMPRQLDKAQEIATLTAAVTIKEIFADVDIEGRASFRMQRTEADELGAVADRTGDPVLLPKIIEQRKSLLELFEILAHVPVSASGGNVGEDGQNFHARMVGGEIFSEPQGPEDVQNRSQRRKRLSLVIGRITWRQPVSDADERLAEERKSRLGAVQPLGPAAQRGGIGYAVRVLERRSGFFPRTMLHNALPQCLTARQQTIVRVRK